MGIFDRKNKQVDQEKPVEKSTQVDLLKSLAELSRDDLAEIIQLVSGKDPDSLSEEESKAVKKYLDVTATLFGRTTNIFTYGNDITTREQRYAIYDEMDESTSYISAALDIVSDDAVQPDEDGTIIDIECENDKVQSLLYEMFEDLEIEERLSKWSRAIVKYGDLFVGVEGDHDKGVTSLNDTIYPSAIERRDYKGKLVAFQEVSGGNMTSDKLSPPWDYVHFRYKGDIYKNKSAYSSDKDNLALTSAYGQSILKPAIKSYAQLRFVENMIILSRLTNSIRRNIFLVNVGEVSPTEAFETIQNYASLLKKDVNLNIEDGVLNSKKHTTTYDEDIFIPVSDPKNDVRIEQVGGDANISEQYDLEYLLNKLFSSLKIPKAYLNYEQDLNARSTLIQLDIRYARMVAQVQTALIGGLKRIANIHLAYHGMDPDQIDFDIKLTNVSAIDLEARLEQKTLKMEAARTMWDIVVSMNDALTAAREQEDVSVGGDIPTSSGGSFAGGSSSSSIPGPFDDAGGADEEEIPPEDVDQSTGESKKVREEDDSLGFSPEPKKSPINLEFIAEHIFDQYFGFNNDDIDQILRRESSKKEESKLSRLHESRRQRVTLDSNSYYPNEYGRDEFKKLEESLGVVIESSEDK